MRILWLSNSGRVPTGYGNQTGLFCPRIKAAGHEVTIFAFYGVEGAPVIDENGIVNLPRLGHLYGNDIVANHAAYCQAEAVVTLIDPWVLDPTIYAGLPWVAWTPVDCEPLLPENGATLKVARRIWAMSRFGETQLHNAGFENVDYVPHGVDLGVFHPADRQAAREKLARVWKQDLAGKFLVTLNMANKGQPSRKGFFEALSGFKIFSDSYPDALLYCHTESQGMWNGEDLTAIMQMIGLDPAKVLFAPQYQLVMGMLPGSYLNDVYNVSSVLLQTSHGEGFGIPILEAQASGCPVIVTDFSAMSELCFSGWKVPGIPFMHSPGATQRIPLIPQVAAALESAYAVKDSADLRQLATYVAQDFAADRVYADYMAPALAKMEAAAKQAPVIAMNRAERRRAARLARKGAA